MAPNANTDGEPDYSQLFVYAGPEQPDPSNMTTFASESFDFQPPAFRGDTTVPGQANIIGSSHHINLGSAPLPYHEITSCRPIDMVRDFEPVVVNYDITNGIDDVLIRTWGGHRVEISIKTEPHTEPSTEQFDVMYTFYGDGPSAPTAVELWPNGWTTVHTYPEFGVDLWTETEMFPVG